MNDNHNSPALCQCPRCGLIDDLHNFQPGYLIAKPASLRECGEP